MQVEAAEVIVVNKTDAVPAQALPHIRELLQSLNPAALLFETAWGAVPLFEVPRLSTLCPSHHAQCSLYTHRCYLGLTISSHFSCTAPRGRGYGGSRRCIASYALSETHRRHSACTTSRAPTDGSARTPR